MHLAEINIGRSMYPLDDGGWRIHGQSDRVNAVAERSDGFIWRLKDESGNATGISGFADPDMMVNLSVWHDASALEICLEYRSPAVFTNARQSGSP